MGVAAQAVGLLVTINTVAYSMVGVGMACYSRDGVCDFGSPLISHPLI